MRVPHMVRFLDDPPPGRVVVAGVPEDEPAVILGSVGAGSAERWALVLEPLGRVEMYDGVDLWVTSPRPQTTRPA